MKSSIYPMESDEDLEEMDRRNEEEYKLEEEMDRRELHISELPDSDAGVVPDTFAMRFSRV